MTHLGTVAPAPGDSVGVLEPEILYLDPETAALIAEVDTILCAALTPTRRPPVPPVARMGPHEARSTGLNCAALVRSRAKASATRAPGATRPSDPTATPSNGQQSSERQVMASEQN